jgi:hypothetical protein
VMSRAGTYAAIASWIDFDMSLVPPVIMKCSTFECV